MKEQLENLRDALKRVEELTQYLTGEGAELTFTIATDQKTVSVKTKTEFSIEVKATINQEI